MTDRENDRAALEAARRAVEDAKTSTGEIQGLLADIHESRVAISTVVQPNGYVRRFRQILQGG